MKEALIGTYVHNIDEKGRLAVPSKIRMELGVPFYITSLLNGCLSVFSEDAWSAFSAKLDAIPQTDMEAQRYVRLIYASACRCEPDKQGRVLLPQLLREAAKIDKEVVMIGASSRAEIWAADQWEAYLNEVPVSGQSMAASLSKHGV